ncbi:MAG TPA: IPT/TIG domain-containing protein [Chitinophagaceae bacterium]|nr:IPT/TIG domain-containing protein [Chitinophagaceae bacterium]
MIQSINKMGWACLLGCLLACALVLSCTKNDDAASSKVVLLSFGPSGAKHGDTITFIGNNLNRVTAVQLTGAMVPSSAFTEYSAERLRFVIPLSTQEGFATLKTPEGDIVSKTKINFTVTAKISSVTREARPGDNITIKGQFLNWVKEVRFAKDIAETTFVSRTLTELVVKVPATAQTGTLFISNGGSKPLTIETDSVLIVTLPAITAMAPNPVLHGSNLTITGTNLDLVKELNFAGVKDPVAGFVSKTATELVVKVPAGTEKGKLVLVANSKVTVSSSQDLEVLLPVVDTIMPNPVAPGADLTISGKNLQLVSGVSFIGVTNPVKTFVSQSATQLVVKVPDGALKGKLSLSVLNSTRVVETAVLDYIGGLPPLADLAYPIYTDALQNGFQDWSYTDIHDFSSTAIVRQGNNSIKAVYGTNGYQGLTFHAGTAASTAGYTKLELSVFGTAGTGGKNLNIVLNGDYGTTYPLTIAEGEWKTVSFALSAIGNPASISEIVLQSAGWSGTIYVDHVGLR